jgi:cell division transport system permease protein
MQRTGLVTGIAPVSETEMRRTLESWLGPTAQAADLPVPAMIDFDLKPGVDLSRARAAITAFAPSGQLTSHADNVRPLIHALDILQWVALALVVLLGTAAGAAVVLAARAALDSHRPTIEILHGIGATDVQVTRLFVRRVALDTLAGSAGGAIIAGAVIVAVAASAGWLSQVGGLTLGATDWAILASLPMVLTVAATVAARAAIMTALEREL